MRNFFSRLFQEKSTASKEYKYGLFYYSNSNNIGDYIQSIAVKQYLPRVDYYIDRDFMEEYNHIDNLVIIFAGWFMHTQQCGNYLFEESGDKKFIWCQCHENGKDLSWPPPGNIKPVFVSFNVSNENLLNASGSKKYLNQHAPIGCRDYHTYQTLKSSGVDAYFSGCSTLTLQSRFKEQDRTNKIYVVDCPVPEEYKDNENVVKVRHTFSREDMINLTVEEKFDKAQYLLDCYATAKLVITSRLHCMAPCLAFNTPIIWQPKHKAGGSKDKHDRPEFSSNRYKGIEELVGNKAEKDKVVLQIRNSIKNKMDKILN